MKAFRFLGLSTGIAALALTSASTIRMGAADAGMVAGANTLDPLSELARRSPGGRPDGAAFSTKPAKPRPAMQTGIQDPIGERVLANIRRRLPSPAQAAEPTPESGPLADETSPGDEMGSEQWAPVAGPIDTLPTEISFAGTPPTGGAPDFPSTSIPSVGIVSPAPTPSPTPGLPGGPFVPPPVSAVPEPATWLTMILGFFVIGSAMRRRRATSYVVRRQLI